MVEKAWPDYVSQSLVALRTATAGVPEGAWSSPTPCAAWTVAQVAQHAGGDQLAYVLKLTDGNGPDFDPFAPTGETVEEVKQLVERAVGLSLQAWAGVSGETVPVPLPPFELPTWLGAGACALDAAVHAWDIAVATGQPSPLDPALAGYLLKVAREIVEPVRAYGMYAAELPAPADGNEVGTLLAYLGRQADWKG